MQILFNITNQKLEQKDSKYIVADSKNYLYARFNFTQDWDNKDKTAIFKYEEQTYQVLINNNICLIPHEVIKKSSFSISVFCGDLITTNKIIVDVIKSGLDNGETPNTPTPDVYASILANSSEAKTIAEDILLRVNRGELNGSPGQDGITPTIGENGNWWIGEQDTGNTSKGIAGINGVGVPEGGTTGQVLAKKSNMDNDTEWVDMSSGSNDVVNGSLPLLLKASDFHEIEIFGDMAYVCELDGLICYSTSSEENVPIISNRDPDTGERVNNSPTVIETTNFPNKYCEVERIDNDTYYPPAIVCEDDERGYLMVVSGVELDINTGAIIKNLNKSLAICMPTASGFLQSGMDFNLATPDGVMPTPTNLRLEEGIYKADILFPDGVIDYQVRFMLLGLEPMDEIKGVNIDVISGMNTYASIDTATLIEDVPSGTYHVLVQAERVVLPNKYLDFGLTEYHGVYVTI